MVAVLLTAVFLAPSAPSALRKCSLNKRLKHFNSPSCASVSSSAEWKDRAVGGLI